MNAFMLMLAWAASFIGGGVGEFMPGHNGGQGGGGVPANAIATESNLGIQTEDVLYLITE